MKRAKKETITIADNCPSSECLDDNDFPLP